MLLVISLSLSLVSPCMAATESGVSNSHLLISNATENVAEATDGDIIYRAHFDKISNVITLVTYNNNEIVDEQVINLNQCVSDANVYSLNATPNLPGFKQSATGFGYLLGDSINEYSCSYELVENGTYQYYGIRLRTTTQASRQFSFQQAVNDMCVLETNIESTSSSAALMSIAAVVVACIGLNGVAAGALIKALDLSLKEETMVKELAELTNQCATHFAQLYKYKI